MHHKTCEQKILTVLFEHARRSPDARSLLPAAIKKAIGEIGNAVHVAIGRLHAKHLIRKQRTGAYAITDLGIQSMKLPPELRPWEPGTALETPHAQYRILEKLRPCGRLPSSRVDVFRAAVKSVSRARVDPTLKERDEVVIKTLSNGVVERQRSIAGLAADDYLSVLTRTFSEEARKLEQSPWLTRIARTLDWGWEKVTLATGSTSEIPFVVQEYVGGPDLPAYLTDKRTGQFSGFADLAEWFRFADNLTEGLKEVHAAGMFHRHIWPATIFMPTAARRNVPGPVFVDLMEAVFYAAPLMAESLSNESPASPDGALLSPLTEDAFVAPEWRGERAREPSRSADLFSLGAVLYYALSGKPPGFSPEMSTDDLKQAVHGQLQNSIAAQNYGVADIVSRCLRPLLRPNAPREHQRVSDIHTMLSDIRTFSGSRRSFVDVGLTLVNGAIKLSKNNNVFTSLAAIELEQLERIFSELEHGSVTVRGEHNDFVLKLCSYLSMLGPGDEYWTVTVPDFWKPANLGVRGRYLSMNAEIARRGARVLRIFLLTADEMRNDEVCDIVKAHVAVQEDLQDSTRFDVRYLIVNANDRQAEKDASVGFWVRGESLVRVKANYYRETRVIKDITISHVAESKEEIRKEWLNRFLKQSHPLREWLDEAAYG